MRQAVSLNIHDSHYSPATMRFLQPDPIGFAGQSANLYTYVDNDPVNFIDPIGLTKFPTESNNVTTGYGPRTSPFSGNHRAVDYGQRGSSGNVYAPESGIISSISQTTNGTNFITLIDSAGLTHGFYHTSTLLQTGAYVNEGSPIGFTDLSGRTTGPHLHYTLQTGAGRDSRINPLNYLYGNDATSPVTSCGGK